MSAAQQLDALAEANRIRLARADLKRAIRNGEVSAAEVLQTDFPDWLRGMVVGQLVQATHRVGRYRCLTILREAELVEQKELGWMTVRQRNVLSELLAESVCGMERVAA